MVTVLALLGILVVLFVAGVLSTRETPLMADVAQDAADLDLPDGPLQPEDVAALRFGMAPRGYRMSEVDAVLERLAAELADRDRRIALFDAEVQGVTSTDVLEATPADLPLPDQPADAPTAWGPSSAAAPGTGPVADPPAGPPQAVAEVPTEVAPLPVPPVPADPAPSLLTPPVPHVHPEAETPQPETPQPETPQPQPQPAPETQPAPAPTTPPAPASHDAPAVDGASAATTDVTPDALTAALEEAGGSGGDPSGQPRH